MSSFSTVLTKLGIDEYSPVLAAANAKEIVTGARTISVQAYALPAWATGVDVAVVEPSDGTGFIIGIVRFGEDIDYENDNDAFARDAALHGMKENRGRGWVVSAARTCEKVATRLKVKYREFYDAVADAGGAAFHITHPIYGKIASISIDHITKSIAAVPVPSGAHQHCLGASVPAVLAACPLNVVKASAICVGGVFRAADGVATLPIAREDLMRGFLVHSDADGRPLAKGGPLRLAFPACVAVQGAVCGSPKPPDLKNCVSLELQDGSGGSFSGKAF